MDAAYLKENVGEVLAEGLTQVVLRQPEDSVEYLANWLLDFVSSKTQKAKKEQTVRTLATRDEANAQAEAKKAAVTAAAKATERADAVARADHFTSFLKNAKSIEGLLQRFCELLKDATEASSVYVAELRNDAYEAAGAEASGYERDASSDYLKYVAVAGGNVDMLKERLPFGEGVTHELFEPEEPQEDEYEEVLDEASGEYVSRLLPKPVRPPRTVFVPNVLVGPKASHVKVFGLPDAGCYLSLRVQFDSCLLDSLFDQAELREQELAERQAEEEELRQQEEEERRQREAEEEEERRRVREEEDEELTEEERATRDAREAEEAAVKAAAEAAKPVETEDERVAREEREAEAKTKKDEETVISMLTKKQVSYAVCIDTLGQGRRLSDAQVGYVTRLGALLQETLVRLDRETYRLERKARAAITEVLSAVEPKNEDERREEIDALEEEARRARGEEAAESVVREDAAWEHRQTLVLGLRQQILEMRGYNVFRGPLAVMQAFFYLLSYKKEEVADSDNRPDWLKMRQLLNDDLVRRLEEYSPREQFAGEVVEKERAAEAEYAELLAAHKGDTAAADRALKKLKRQRRTEARDAGLAGEAAEPSAGSADAPLNAPAALEALISTVEPEAVQSANYVAYELLGLVEDAVALLRCAATEHRHAKAEERARQRAEREAAEEEARIKAEEEAAAAEARAAAGIIDEVDEGED
jgi:hypothetical protein